MVRPTSESENWKIARDRTACTRPGCPLPTADAWNALLEFPDCVRRDLCDTCFAERCQELGEDAEPIYWRVRRRVHGVQRTGPVLDLEGLRGLFDRLGAVAAGEAGGREVVDGTSDSEDLDADADAQRRQQFAELRYFVALLLVRKRSLKIVDPRNEDEELADLIVVDPKDSEMDPVALYAPPLDTDRLSGLKDELLAALDEMGEG